MMQKVDRYLGMDRNGFLHNTEVHLSGKTPDTWICGSCGTSLSKVQHMVGVQKGHRYCMTCFNKGEQLKDMPDYTDYLDNNKAILWQGAKKRNV